MESIYSISVHTNEGDDFYLLLGDFLDSFYRASSEKRADMIADPPVDMEKPEFVPFLAATAHKLALDHNVAAPHWVFEPRCYLPGMALFFACNARGNLRLLFMSDFPGLV